MKLGYLVMGLLLASVAMGTDAAFAQQAPPPDGGRPGQAEGDAQRGPGARGDRGSRGGRDGDARGGRRDRGGNEAEGRSRRGGQNRGRGWGDPSQGLLAGPASRLTRSIFQPDYMTRDLAIIVEGVRLDSGQQDVVEMLLEDYDANFQLAVDETQASMSDLGEGSGVSELEADRVDQLRGQMESMREEMRAARDAADARPEPEGEQAREPLTEEQRAERNAIRENFRERMTFIRDEFRSVRESQMKSDVMQDLLGQQLTLLKQFSRAREYMGDEVTGAITAILSEPQLASWDNVQRQIRRLRLLPAGRLQGERTDITSLTDSFVASSVQEESLQAIRDAVTSWELDLDVALLQRQAFDDTGVFLLLSAMTEMDYEAMMKIFHRRQPKAEAVRDVTDAAIDLIAASLPAEQGEDFRRRAIQNGYDRVFNTTRSQRAIIAATELEDLDEELLAAVAALLVDCNLEMMAAAENILVVIRRHDEPREIRFVERMIERQAGEQQNEQREADPIRAVFEKREELDDAYLEQLRSLLGEELVATLPGGKKREDRGERGRGGFGGPGGGDPEARRAAFMKQFDANGNGDIDDSEREAIREHFRGMGGWGGGRGGPPPFRGN
ncbi:MAG: hypothetical protein P8I91_09665 [Phycisphaerales bacterium]|nr:hypothetical protein [Phycisphaerales bacterium]